MNYLLIIAGFILFIFIDSALYQRRMKKIARERGKPDICKFARDFEYRKIDTRIIREVWNEMQAWLGDFEGSKFPVHSDDRFEETYQMDEEDLDEIYWDISDRLNVSTEKLEVNPFYERVNSVKDLVLFIHYQQKGSYA